MQIFLLFFAQKVSAAKFLQVFDKGAFFLAFFCNLP